MQATSDQMHQLEIVKVETHPFRVQKSAIGRIAYNDDVSTLVLTPFSGRVVRLIAKVGDVVKRGDPLFEIDSPEVVQPQNDFIAAIAALNKARAQLNLAQIVEKRQHDLYEGKAAPLKEFQLAEADLVAAQNDMRAAETAVDAARNRLSILGLSSEQIAALQEKREISRATPIHAPIDGTVIARKVGPGQFVRNDSGDPLFTIADLSTMWLKALVPENGYSVGPDRAGGRGHNHGAARPRVQGPHHRHRGVGRRGHPPRGRALGNSQSRRRAQVRNVREFHDRRRAQTEISPAVPSVALIREGDRVSVWVEIEPLLFKRREGRDRSRAGRTRADSRRTQAGRADRRARRDLRRQRVAAMTDAGHRSGHAA